MKPQGGASLTKRRGKPPVCRGCGATLPSNRPRVQLKDGTWACPDCAYRVDHPDAARVVRAPKASGGPKELLPLYPTPRHTEGDPLRSPSNDE